jgi:hypothetical protein
VITLDAKLARIADGDSKTKDFGPRRDGEDFKSKSDDQTTAASHEGLRTGKSPDRNLRFANEITDASVRG